ncbi:MAG: hypothetical protein R3F60_09640 [bacterium]
MADILWVDDEPHRLDYEVYELTLLHHNVRRVESVDVARAVLARARWDLVLLDQLMPLGGLELSPLAGATLHHWLRYGDYAALPWSGEVNEATYGSEETPVNRDTPVILISAIHSAVTTTYWAAESVVVIPKPIFLDSLLSGCRRALKGAD